MQTKLRNLALLRAVLRLQLHNAVQSPLIPTRYLFGPFFLAPDILLQRGHPPLQPLNLALQIPDHVMRCAHRHRVGIRAQLAHLGPAPTRHDPCADQRTDQRRQRREQGIDRHSSNHRQNSCRAPR